MKVKLIVPAVVNGGVWKAGDVVEIHEDEAKRLIEAGYAESVSSAAPRPASSSAFKKDAEK